jgi:lysophospholipase L1-like esterase
VLIVGDSNVALAAYSINWELVAQRPHNGYQPTLANRLGVGIRAPDCPAPEVCPADYWQGKLAGVEADVLVVNLGVNDTASPGTATTQGYLAYPQKIDWFMALAEGRPVVWTNLPCPLLAEVRRSGCVRVNVNLASATTRWPNLTVLDWNKEASPHPEWMGADGVHLTSPGHLAWTRLVLAELDRRFPA